MSDPGDPSLDWDSIFERARHHIVRRVLLVGAVAALGALLLFSGGTASWKVIAHADKAKPAATKKKGHNGKPPKKDGHKGDHNGSGNEGHHHHKPPLRPPHPPPPPPPDPCSGDAAASKEYCNREAISTQSKSTRQAESGEEGP